MAVLKRRRVAPVTPAKTPAAPPAKAVVRRRVSTPPPPPPEPEKRGEADQDEGSRFDYLGVIRRYAEKVRNPMTAIRAKCVECSGGSLKEVHECRVTTCALHPFRMGVNPFHKKTKERLAKQDDGDDE